jgi:hypothetical protein
LLKHPGRLDAGQSGRRVGAVAEEEGQRRRGVNRRDDVMQLLENEGLEFQMAQGDRGPASQCRILAENERPCLISCDRRTRPSSWGFRAVARVVGGHRLLASIPKLDRARRMSHLCKTRFVFLRRPASSRAKGELERLVDISSKFPIIVDTSTYWVALAEQWRYPKWTVSRSESSSRIRVRLDTAELGSALKLVSHQGPSAAHVLRERPRSQTTGRVHISAQSKQQHRG